ncbi:hypothetical protein REPUB_Repub03eG0269800 [Reevesia pubescens]
MEAASAGEPPTQREEEMLVRDRGAKRDRAALEEITNTVPAIDMDPQVFTGAGNGGNKSSYLSKLMNRIEHHSVDQMEEGEIPPEAYDSEDDTFDENHEGPCILLSKEDKRRIRSPWKNTLIVKLLGRSISYMYLCNRVKQLWSLVGDFQAVDLDNGYYCFRFNNVTDYNHVLLGGPWVIANHYLTVRRWTPCFRSEEATIDTVAAWIRFPGMPLEFYDNEVLKKMGNIIGQTLMIDRNTLVASRGRYARMCVEVDLTKPLVPKIYVGSRWQRVEYEGLGMMCFHCGKFGHVKDQCIQLHEEVNTEGEHETVANMQGKNGETNMDNTQYGPWMIAMKGNGKSRQVNIQKQRPRDEIVKSGGQVSKTGSRFAILHDVEEEQEVMEYVPSSLEPVPQEKFVPKAKKKGIVLDSEGMRKELQATALVSNKVKPQNGGSSKGQKKDVSVRVASSALKNKVIQKDSSIGTAEVPGAIPQIAAQTTRYDLSNVICDLSRKENPPDVAPMEDLSPEPVLPGKDKFVQQRESAGDMDVEVYESTD